VSCLEEGERTLNECEGKQVYIQGADHFWLTGAKDEGGYGETLDSEISPGLGEGCFMQHISHVLDAVRNSNQWVFCSPESN
jgi:hypothetical protein